MMKTLFFCTSYISDESVWRNRYKRWLDHHRLIFADATFCMIDDASPFVPDTPSFPLLDAVSLEGLDASKGGVLRFRQRLGRHGTFEYPGWWRSFLHSCAVADKIGANKIIHVESDAFILSCSLRDYLQSLSSGWTALWCPEHKFPETAIQVICEDQFVNVKNFLEKNVAQFSGVPAERLFPFTDVNKEFVGDRYNERRVPLLHDGLLRSKKFNRLKFFQQDRFRQKIPAHADFAVQVSADQHVWIRE